MNITLMVIAIASLLLVPGPTNTLLVVSGSTVGARGSLLLPAGELLGYVLSTSFLILIIAPFVGRNSALSSVFCLLCACILAYQALMLAKGAVCYSAEPRSAVITPVRVALVTFFNPKNLVLAFVIFPRAGFEAKQLGEWFLYFGPICLLMGSVWIFAGAALGSLTEKVFRANWFYWAGSAALSTFSVLLLTSALVSA